MMFIDTQLHNYYTVTSYVYKNKKQTVTFCVVLKAVFIRMAQADI